MMGEGSLRIVVLDWDAAAARASPIRHRVFVGEQGVPEDIELDEHDEVSRHALALTPAGEAVATGRLLPDGHIGRMAVLPEWRGQGVGGGLLQALMDEAARLGIGPLVLNAQIHAEPFYRRHGFRRRGPEFMEAGIRHVTMWLEAAPSA